MPCKTDLFDKTINFVKSLPVSQLDSVILLTYLNQSLNRVQYVYIRTNTDEILQRSISMYNILKYSLHPK